MTGYLVTIEGDYFGVASEYDRKREKFPYRITVKVPQPEGALSLIKNKLLDKVLRRNYDDYHAWRTHQLVSITNLDGSKVQGLSDPRLMDFNDLADYVRRNKLPLKLELYTDLGFMRTMVYLAETNQHEFLIKQANLAKECEEDKALAELNPELYSSQGSKGLHPTQREVTKKALKDSRVDNTTIIEGKKYTVAKFTSSAGAMGKTVVAPSSVLLTENKPEPQKVEKVFVEGKGYINAEDFEEDFTKESEKEFETYSPYDTDKKEDEKPVASVEDL